MTVVAWVLAAGAMQAQNIGFYDQQGRPIGRSEARGGTTYFYDDRGRPTGRAQVR